MRLTIVGGGGFRVPLVHGALLGDHSPVGVDELVLHDVDATRLEVMAAACAQQAAATPDARPVGIRTTTDLDDAVRDSDIVFSAIRVGGLAGRTADERVALDLGLLGQETTGPGGLAYAMRTVPVAVDLAERIAALAPNAWTINFTNPAGLVTQAMQTVLGRRVIGICDSPVGLARRATRALRLPADSEVAPGYAGLNHLGWLRTLVVDGTDRLPELLADTDALLTTEEGRLFGPEWIRSLGAIPNEYLYYWYFTREAVASIRGSARTRGEFLLDQQSAFYAEAAADPRSALARWHAARRRREETYLAEARERGEERAQEDLSGGYEGVALAITAAVARDEPATLVLNVRGDGAIPGLPPDAVVEVPCRVDADGPVALPTAGLDGAMLGLVQQVKAVEELAIRAALTGSPGLARTAFALHPLVDSVTTATLLLEGYRARIPDLDRVFAARTR